MSITITGKLNRGANVHDSASGTNFFIDLGVQAYDFKTKEKVWTNYSCALFAKDNQANFYKSVLVEGAIVEVSGSGVIIRIDPNGKYAPKLEVQDCKLGFTFTPEGTAPQQVAQVPRQVQAPAFQGVDTSDVPF